MLLRMGIGYEKAMTEWLTELEDELDQDAPGGA